MTEDNTTETSESQEGSESNDSGSSEESPVIKDLRKQLRDAQKELKSVPSRSELEADIRQAVERESAIEQQLVAAGQPSGLRPLVEEKLGDADVTPEGVVEALKAIGFEVTASDDGGTQETQQADNLSEVANLGNQVAQAANQQTPDNLTDKINAAETPQELAQIMAEAGQS